MSGSRTMFGSMTQRPDSRKVFAEGQEWTVARLQDRFQASSLGLQLKNVPDGLYFSSKANRKWIAWDSMGAPQTRAFSDFSDEELAAALLAANEGWPGEPGYRRKRLKDQLEPFSLQLHPAERVMRIMQHVMGQPRDHDVRRVFSPALGIPDGDIPEFYVRWGELLEVIDDLREYVRATEEAGFATAPTLQDSLQRIWASLRDASPNEPWKGPAGRLPADPIMTLAFVRTLLPISQHTPPEYTVQVSKAIEHLREIEQSLELDDETDPVAKAELLRAVRRMILSLDRAWVTGGDEIESVVAEAVEAGRRAEESGQFGDSVIALLRHIPVILRVVADGVRIAEAFGLLPPGSAPPALPPVPPMPQLNPGPPTDDQSA